MCSVFDRREVFSIQPASTPKAILRVPDKRSNGAASIANRRRILT
jgi:hypothetical protein